MMFILRAAFWIAVVAAFVPPGFSAAGGLFASDMERLLAEPAARAAQSLQQQPQPAPGAQMTSHATGICAEYGELCDIWDHVTGFGGYVGTVALSQADAMIEASRETGSAKPAAQTR
ncbi:MAG TPA: hypothetical protein DF715_12925 [Oceanicaulis sp.]|jgi:hypothetical protein|uniref:Uncharacterized protein n=1 Tax=Glycocaulis albus TaxID=1382801 RepID=A0ABQ1XXI9_9PROT|nr:hypothetical protein [Glycocaulis albus]MBV5257492.1 hypothetical protein [Synechococcus moorigangaii CMS01]GGH06323.1 hypothetical protein GCM10007420_23530 [Glycocaulis albus]HCY56382.1 hypothetical protein [Oceanicaulis sp.]